MRPLTTMGRAMQDIAQGEGDLTRRLVSVTKDEFGELAGAFNQFVERIHASISEVSSATRQVHDLSQRVMASSNASIIGSDEQSARTNSVAAAINELGAATQEIARNAADASQHASGASEQADKYICNFSVFQSLPDTWAIGQVLPILPLHRLNEEPLRRAVLQDLTCDSDGKIKQYVDEQSIETSLTVQRQNWQYLTNGPGVRQALEHREVADVLVGQLVVEFVQHLTVRTLTRF